MWPIIASIGANVVGNAIGSAASKKERRAAREMQRKQADATQKAEDLGGDIYKYARSVGTPQDAMFYGGLAGAKYKKNLADSKDALSRQLSRSGVSPTSNAFLARFGSNPTQELYGAGAYNDALMDRINQGVSVRQNAQNAVLKPFDYQKSLQEQYANEGASKYNQAKGLFDLFGSGVGSYISGLEGSGKGADQIANTAFNQNLGKTIAGFFGG